MEKQNLEVLRQEIPITDVAQSLGYTVKKEGSVYSLQEHDSLKLFPETNTFYRFSNQHHGSIFDLVMELEDKSFAEALDYIQKAYSSHVKAPSPDKVRPPTAPANIQSETKEPFVLPPRNDTHKHVFAYLTQKRYLDAELVSECMKRGLLYEDERHNAVFVGYSYEKPKHPVFATRRGTYSNFKRDVKSSDPSVGFRISHSASSLFVTEAPIDALSLICIAKLNQKDPNQYHYLSLCGAAKEKALYRFLDHHKEVKQVIFALDNDKAGKDATDKMCKHLKEQYPNIRLSQFRFKENDLNDHLKALKTKKAPKAQDVEV